MESNRKVRDTESCAASAQTSLFDGPSGVIGSLLGGTNVGTNAMRSSSSTSNALGTPKAKKKGAFQKKAKKKSSIAVGLHDDADTLPESGAVVPLGNVSTSAKWQEHSEYLQAHMLDSGYSMIAENTFLSVAATSHNGIPRPRSAPCSRSGSHSSASLGGPSRARRPAEQVVPPKTPELWPCWRESEPDFPVEFVLPTAAHPVTPSLPTFASSSTSHGQAVPRPDVEIIPPDRIIEWLVANAVRNNDRFAEVERRVVGLEAENAHLREVIASLQCSATEGSTVGSVSVSTFGIDTHVEVENTAVHGLADLPLADISHVTALPLAIELETEKDTPSAPEYINMDFHSAPLSPEAQSFDTIDHNTEVVWMDPVPQTEEKERLAVDHVVPDIESDTVKMLPGQQDASEVSKVPKVHSDGITSGATGNIDKPSGKRKGKQRQADASSKAQLPNVAALFSDVAPSPGGVAEALAGQRN